MRGLFTKRLAYSPRELLELQLSPSSLILPFGLNPKFDFVLSKPRLALHSNDVDHKGRIEKGNKLVIPLQDSKFYRVHKSFVGKVALSNTQVMVWNDKYPRSCFLRAFDHLVRFGVEMLTRMRIFKQKAIAEADFPKRPASKTNQSFKRAFHMIKIIRMVRKNDLEETITTLAGIEVLYINHQGQLIAVINLVFSEVLKYPDLSSTYANLLKQLCELPIKMKITDQVLIFNEHLKSRCQEESEKEFHHDIDIRGHQAEIVRFLDNESITHFLTEELENAKYKSRRRQLIHIKLMSQLYEMQLIDGLIMTNCINNMLRNRDDRMLMFLCNIMKHIGGQLKKEKNNTKFNSIIKQLEAIANDEKTNLEVSKFINHVIELHANANLIGPSFLMNII